MKPKQFGLSLICITVFLDVIGYGMMFPSMPRLISGLIHGDIGTAASYGGRLAFTFGFVQFFFAPILGNLSDRFGRRPILLLSLFPLGIDGLAATFAPSIEWLFVGKIIGGTISGSFSLASAYVADITSSENRSKAFGFLNASAGIGFIIGPVAGGLLTKFGSHVPFITATSLSFVNIVYTFFFVSESLTHKKRREFNWKHSNPAGVFFKIKKMPAVAGLIIAVGLLQIAGDTLENVWSYFAIEKFDWDEETIGYSLGTLGLMFALVQGVLCPVLLPKIGDKKSVYVGLIFQITTFILIAFVCKGWMIFALTVPFALSSIYGPALQGIISNRVSDTEQGELQGGLSALNNLTSIIGPPTLTGIFAVFTDKAGSIYFPGMPFIFAALLVIIAGLKVKGKI